MFSRRVDPTWSNVGSSMMQRTAGLPVHLVKRSREVPEAYLQATAVASDRQFAVASVDFVKSQTRGDHPIGKWKKPYGSKWPKCGCAGFLLICGWAGSQLRSCKNNHAAWVMQTKCVSLRSIWTDKVNRNTSFLSPLLIHSYPSKIPINGLTKSHRKIKHG